MDTDLIVSFAAVFWDVTQRSTQSFFWVERCVTSQKTAAKETTDLMDQRILWENIGTNICQSVRQANDYFKLTELRKEIRMAVFSLQASKQV